MSGLNQTELHLPTGQRYECVQCGRSCRMFNEVGVEEKSARVLESLDYRPLLPEPVRDESPLIPARSDPDRTVLRWHCGQCVFQRDDHLCALHATFGFENKPRTCQDFPFRYVESPGGVYVGVSFACTAILQNVGSPVEERRAAMETGWRGANSRRPAGNAVRLDRRHRISWEAYQALEDDLLAILRVEGVPFPRRLAAQSLYLDLYLRLLKQVRPSAPGQWDAEIPPDSGEAPDTEVLKAVRRRYDPGSGGGELFRLAARLRPLPALQRAFLGLVTAFRQNLYERTRPSRLAAVARILRHYAAHSLKLGRVDLMPMEHKFSYAAFRSVRFAPEEDPQAAELMARWLEHTLFRKDLLLAESVWLGQRFLLMHAALVRWYAVGHAAAAGRDRVVLEDLHEAIRAVELHYLFHTRFAQLFEKFPTLGMILDAIVAKPSYPAAMAGDPV